MLVLNMVVVAFHCCSNLVLPSCMWRYSVNDEVLEVAMIGPLYYEPQVVKFQSLQVMVEEVGVV